MKIKQHKFIKDLKDLMSKHDLSVIQGHQGGVIIFDSDANMFLFWGAFSQTIQSELTDNSKEVF